MFYASHGPEIYRQLRRFWVTVGDIWMGLWLSRIDTSSSAFVTLFFFRFFWGFCCFFLSLSVEAQLSCYGANLLASESEAPVVGLSIGNVAANCAAVPDSSIHWQFIAVGWKVALSTEGSEGKNCRLFKLFVAQFCECALEDRYSDLHIWVSELEQEDLMKRLYWK